MANQIVVQNFRRRFALPLDRLQGIFSDCGVATGDLAAVESLAEQLETSGVLADSVSEVLRSVTDAEGVIPTRMEMLELLCVAVSGSNVENSGPALRRPLRQLLVFVNGVLLLPREQVVPNENGKDLEIGVMTEHEGKPIEDDAESPENFYVVENFGFVNRRFFAEPLMGGAERALDSSRSAGEQAVESDKEQSTCTQGEDPPRSPAPAAPLMLSVSAEAEEHFQLLSAVSGAATEKSVAVNDVWIEQGEPLVEETSEPAAQKRRILSKPALFACAVVVSFIGGMLVPRLPPQRRNLPASHEGGGADNPAAEGQEGPKSVGTLRLAGVPRPLSLTSSGLQAGESSEANDSGPLLQPGRSAQPAPADGERFAASPTIPIETPNTTSIAPDSAQANLLYSPQPSYPALAKLANVEGEVVLAIVISTDGSVIASRVLEGQPLLRGAAESAVRRWRFRPFFEKGRLSQVQTSVVVDVRPNVQQAIGQPPR